MTHRIIRGTRIVHQLDEASTEQQLHQNVVSAFPSTTKRHNATGEVAIQNIQYIPYVGTKVLHIKSTATSNGHQYQQVIQFNGVTFENEDTDTNVTVPTADGREQSMQPLELSRHNVKVRCTCLDFYYRFANYNSQDKSLVGKAPPVYVKKTDRPPVNPSRTPGVCKHLLKLVEELQKAGVVR